MKFFLFIIFLFSLLSVSYAAEIRFSIYHTNDLHSHFDSVKGPNRELLGGYDRLSSAINKFRNEKKSKGEIVFGVDAGDFFSGTIFSALGPSSKTASFPEYEFFAKNYYDVMILGNHEFDAYNAGLLKMLSKIDKLKKSLHSPTTLISTNIVIKKISSKLTSYIGEYALVPPYLVKDYHWMGTNENLRVGFLGVLGPDAARVSSGTREDVGFVGFTDETAKKDLSDLSDQINSMAAMLRERHQVQVVVLAYHGGGAEAKKLAKKLEGVDVILAGHTHEEQLDVVNDIVIAQTGSYGKNLGVLELSYNTESKKVTLLDPQKKTTIAINKSVPSSPAWKSQISQWRYEALRLMGESNNPEQIVFTPKEDYLHVDFAFNPFGTFLTSAIRNELNQENKENKKKKEDKDDVEVYFTVNGLIRSSFYKGVPYNREDIFELLSIGFDDKLVPGVDVVTFYLTPKEVKQVINFLEIYSFITSNFLPVISDNLTFKYSKWGIPFLNRIRSMKLNGEDLSEHKGLIKVATNRYIINNLTTIEIATKGFIKIDPKNKEGQSIRTYPTFSKEYKLLTNYFLRPKKSVKGGKPRNLPANN